MQAKRFLSPRDVAQELGISSATVLRLIHAGSLPAIVVSERIYRIPSASFEMYKAGTLRRTTLASLGATRPRPRLDEGETLPKSRDADREVARAR